MQLVTHKELPDDEQFRESWRNLLVLVDQPQVFYTPEWASAVSRSYSLTVKPLLFCAFDNEQLVGVAALAADYALGEARFLAGTTADYCDFICINRFRRQFIDLVLEQLENFNLPTLILANLPEDSGTLKTFPSVARPRGYAVLARPAYSCARVTFNSVKVRAELKDIATRKQVVRRHMKALAKLGSVQVRHITDRDGIEAALPDFVNLHVSRFLSTGRISNLAMAERRAFLRELGRQLSNDGGIVLSQLIVGDRAIAWNYGFRYADSWFWYQPTFAEEFQQYSPGLCLLAKILERACDEPQIGVLDLGLGAEEYKERWANSSRETLHVTASRSPGTFFREMLRYHATRELDRVPGLSKIVRKGFSKVVQLRQHHGDVQGVTQASKQRIVSQLQPRPQIVFFESIAAGGDSKTDRKIVPTTLAVLAQAAVQYDQDAETHQYLLRSASRMRQREFQGFAALNHDDVPVHFCWVAPFTDFYVSELKRKLSSPRSNSVLIFDCWTPRAVRGAGHYSATIECIAREYQQSGRNVWIFAAETSDASLRGIRRAGFAERFAASVRRYGFGGRTTIRQISPRQEITQATSIARTT